MLCFFVGGPAFARGTDCSSCSGHGVSWRVQVVHGDLDMRGCGADQGICAALQQLLSSGNLSSFTDASGSDTVHTCPA